MQQDKARSEGPTLAARAARYHVPVIVVCLLLGVAAGWYVWSARTQSYTSSASVLINPAEGNPYAPSPRNDELVSLETEAQIAGSDVVLTQAARTPGAPSAEDIGQSLQVVVPTNTQILQISFTHEDQTVARDTAQAVAQAYLDNRRQRSEGAIAGQVARILTQTETVIRDLRAATAAAQEGSAATRAFQSQLADGLNAELVNLRAQRTALENVSPRPGQVISPANLPGGPGLLQQIAFPVVGGLVGLLAGLLLAMLLERRRGVVRSRRDAEALGIPVLMTPSVSRRRRRSSSEVAQETIRRLRSAVLDASPQVSAIAVAGLGKEGTDAGVAPELAVSLAKVDKQVVLVDAVGTLGDGGTGDGFSRRGLNDLLSGRQADVASMLAPSAESRLRLLFRGHDSADASDYFVVHRLKAVLSPLRSANDFVVVGTPHLLSTRGEALARATDLTVLIVIPGETRLADLAATVEEERLPAERLLAVVVPRKAIPSGRGPTVGARRGETGELTRAERESAASKVS